MLTTPEQVSQGVSILLTGLAIQALNLLAFLGTYRYFRYKLSHRRYILDDRYSHVYLSRWFTYFMICVFRSSSMEPRTPANTDMIGIQVVVALLLLRTAVRIAIFADGLDSAFATSQVTTFLLDDTIVLVAVLIIAICPPGRAFGGAWASTSPMAASPDRPHTLPLRLRRHRRNRSSRINKRVISLPYTSPSASPRFSPGYTPRGGMTPGLPAHPSPRAPPLISPLMSPRNNPVHQRAPYELSPTQEVPYMAPQESPGMDSTMWMASPPIDHGRKRRMRAGSGPETNQMVDGDALWS